MFADGVTLGVTARVQLAHAYGVVAVDFDLADMSATLQQAVSESKPGLWAYLVEVSGAETGRLLAMAVHSSGGDELGQQRIGGEATSAEHPCIAASAKLLEDEQWREGVFISEDSVPGCEVYEGIASRFGSRGMDWLLVLGQATGCTAANGEVWSYGECKVCGAGTVPLDDGRTCARCAQTEEPNVNRSACNCRQGFENFGRLLDWHPELSGELAATGDDINACLSCDNQIFPLHNIICPGGSKHGFAESDERVINAYPKPGWWMADLTAREDKLELTHNSSRADAGRRTLADLLYACPVQSCEGMRCRPNMTGLLCAECIHKSHIKSPSGVCVPQCEGGAAKYWRNTLLKFLLLTLLLRWKTGQLDVAIDGATIAHLTFFGQTFLLLGQFGRGDLFGFRDLARSTGASDDVQPDATACSFRLPMGQQFWVTVAVIPLYSAVILLVMLLIERGKIRPVGLKTIQAGVSATGAGRISTPGAAFPLTVPLCFCVFVFCSIVTYIYLLRCMT
eukprot:COSAG02_NODE_72_length_41961_cov_13.243658_2_plen_509_part_00